MDAKQVDVMVADASHEVYVDKILDTIREAAKVRGTGIAERTHEYVTTKMKEGKAIIALCGDDFAGFTYIESWGNKQYVATSGARFFGYEHELTDMVYGFNMEELLLASLYDPDKLEKMLAEHDVHKPQCCGAVIYFQGRLLTIEDQSAAVRLGEKEQVEKPWIFYQEGEKVIEHGPNPYLALYYVKTENRKEMDLLTEEFYEEMHILDPNGQEVAYHNQIPDYAPAEK